MNWVRNWIENIELKFDFNTTIETKLSNCRVERLGFKRRATAVPRSNLILSVEFDTAVARRLKRAYDTYRKFTDH